MGLLHDYFQNFLLRGEPDGSRTQMGQGGEAKWEWGPDGGIVGPDGSRGSYLVPHPLSDTPYPYLVPHPSYLLPIHQSITPPLIWYPTLNIWYPIPYLTPDRGTPTLTSHQSEILYSLVFSNISTKRLIARIHTRE